MEVLTNKLLGNVRLSLSVFSPNSDDLYEETQLSFALAEESLVSVSIYSTSGRPVRTLLKDSNVLPDDIPFVIWDGKDGKDSPVVSGIYLLKITAIPAGDTAFKKPETIFKEVVVIK